MGYDKRKEEELSLINYLIICYFITLNFSIYVLVPVISNSAFHSFHQGKCNLGTPHTLARHSQPQ